MTRYLWLMLFFSGVSVGEELLLSCPAFINATWQSESPPGGWETIASVNTVRHRLAGGAFTNGHPKLQAYLKPYTADTGTQPINGERRTVYRFPSNYPEGIWLVCTYRNTPAIVFKRLPTVPKICEITSPLKNGPEAPLEKISCR